MDWWIWVILGLAAWFLLSSLISGGDKNRKCAWCDGTKIKFKNGKVGSWYWEYRNKDGSKDKRVKDNFQSAGYHSEFECEECSATTKFSHFVDKQPSRNANVWLRTLVTKGNNDRKGTDWENDKGTTVHSNQANRKNK